MNVNTMTEQKINIEERAAELYDYVTKYIKEDYKYNEIKQFLMDGGMDEETAKAIIAQVLVLQKKKAKGEMKLGAYIVLAGVVIVILGFLLPFEAGNPRRHVIIYGPIIGGLIMFFKGRAKSK
jgi:hypothetical protein